MSTRAEQIHCLAVMPGMADDQKGFRALEGICASVVVHDHARPPGLAGATTEPRGLAPRKLRWRVLADVVGNFLRSSGPKIVHDIMVSRGSWYARRRLAVHRQKDVRTVLTLISPTPGYFFRAGWNRADGVGPSWGEVIRWYLPFYGWRTMEAWISCLMADALIGVTDQIVDDASHYYRLRDRPTLIMPQPVDTDFWCPSEVTADAGGSPHGRYILYAGDVLRRKGFDLAVQALAHARKVFPDLILKVPGRTREVESDIPWYAPVIESLGMGPYVEFLGAVPREQLRDFYRNAVALVYPSFDEGSPRVVKEAAACGCPVVTSRIPGTIVVDPDERFFRFCALDASSVWAGLREAMERPRLRSEMIAIGRRAMVDCFSPAATASRTAAFYEEVFSK